MPRQATRTTVTATHTPLARYKGDLLALGLYKDTKRLPKEFAALDARSDGQISNLLKLGDFTGASCQTALLYRPRQTGCRRIMLVGLGEKNTCDTDTLRQAAGTAARIADKLGATRLGVTLHSVLGRKIPPDLAGQVIAEGAIAGRYEYRDYLPEKNTNGKHVNTMRVTLVEPTASTTRKLTAGARIGSIFAHAQNRARMIANKPGNEINPPALAREAKRLARETELRCTVFDHRRLAHMNMNGILAVGSGSAGKPRLITLEYNRRRGKTAPPDLVLVGKAVTFDSGGISIKPSAGMETMKFDKSGGCAVLGIMTALPKLKLPLRVVGLIPAVENLPSHTAYRPGDIIRTYSGKTVEVQNTDAEGRMILADALAYAAKMNPAAIIDLATLTGGCVIALGEHHAGLFTNNEPLMTQLKNAAKTSGDPLWPLPCGPQYLEQMKSKIADLKNVAGRDGAACTAAAFLTQFVNDTPFAHIDIAGTADTDKEKPYRTPGATGFAVKLILEYLRALPV